MTLARLRLALLLGLLAIAFGSPVAARAQTAGPEYVVQSGDTLYTIAARFGTTVAALQSANTIADPATIYAGQVLVIPGFEGITGRLTPHTVALGDTLASLSLRFGVSPETFARLNHVVNPSTLYLGEEVYYPEGGRTALKLASAVNRTVAPGETLLALAAQYRVSPFAIASVNGLMPAAPLIPGQSLFIPNAGNTPTGLPWPLVFLTMSPSPPEQGRTLRLIARLDGEAVLSGAFDLHPLRFAEEGGAWYALQGIEAEAEPGLHSFTITVTLPSGQSTSFAQLIPVRRMDYGTQNLPPVDPLTIDPTVTEPEWEYLKSFTTQFTPARYWQGVFALPFGGRVSSPFGIVRTYNNGQFVSSHTGTDFTGRPGSPIYAAAAGVVVVAEPLTVRGNATLIDHGWGVYTGYWHQSEIKVEVGDVVRAGQEIGLLGSTGRVTGPNLHWELWVGGAPIDPMEWTETPFP